MSSRSWIDNEAFIGLDRRAGDNKRLFDRRRARGGFSEPPSTATILRQLKSASLGLHSKDQWDRFIARLEGAIGLARAHNEIGCAQALVKLRQVIDQARPTSPPSPATVEAHLERARLACTK